MTKHSTSQLPRLVPDRPFPPHAYVPGRTPHPRPLNFMRFQPGSPGYRQAFWLSLQHRQPKRLAETEFHHPLLVKFGWGFATIVLQTKKIKGLHENDLIMAAKINEICQAVSRGADS